MKVFGFFLVLLTCGSTVAAESPNVLFISIDDLNDWVGVFEGNPQVKTPNIDRFNEMGGLVMYDAHTVSTVCGPSRSSILTGKYPHSTGLYANNTNIRNAPKAKDLATLPEYFSQHGYHTLSRGKIFHPHPWEGVKRADLGQWAFDEWVPADGWAGPISDERPVNGLPDLPGGTTPYHSWAFDWGPTVGNDETMMKDYKTVEWAVEQLNNRDFEKPFFMAVGISKPHLQWWVPQKYFDMYPLGTIILPEAKTNDLEDIRNRWDKPIDPHDTWVRVDTFGERHDEAVQAYLANVSFVDDCIGVLLDGLEKSPYTKNTIVVLWSDHGWHLGEKQRYGKTMLWQETTRVPLMVRVPGVTPKGEKSMGVVNLLDLYPTLLELCGLPANPENEGRSFVPLLENPALLWDEPILTDYGYGGHRVYDGRFSYIVFSNRGTEELYDHQNDPAEWKNLADDPEFASVKERLIGYLPEKTEPMAPRNQ